MKQKIPFNAGDLVKAEGGQWMIMGHIWWPVEKRNAYQCYPVDEYGEPIENKKPAYIWDNDRADFTIFVPKTRAA